jgi:cell division protein FtsB
MAPMSPGIWQRQWSVDMDWFWGLLQLLFWLLVLFLFIGWVVHKLGLQTELSERELTEELAAQKRRNDALEKRLQKLEDDKRG